MSFTINVRMKKLGKQKNREPSLAAFTLEKKPETVRELLTALVVQGVREYNERKEEEQMLSYLTRTEIEEQASAGKVSFGFRRGNDAAEEEAVENALQCFEDGIYRVFAGEDELTGLNDEIPWTKDIVFTFIRLTMLSGW